MLGRTASSRSPAFRECAQEKVNKRMQNDVNCKPRNLMLPGDSGDSGNSGFVPAWFSQAQIATAPVLQPVLRPVPVVVPAVLSSAPVKLTAPDV